MLKCVIFCINALGMNTFLFSLIGLMEVNGPGLCVFKSTCFGGKQGTIRFDVLCLKRKMLFLNNGLSDFHIGGGYRYYASGVNGLRYRPTYLACNQLLDGKVNIFKSNKGPKCWRWHTGINSADVISKRIDNKCCL